MTLSVVFSCASESPTQCLTVFIFPVQAFYALSYICTTYSHSSLLQMTENVRRDMKEPVSCVSKTCKFLLNSSVQMIFYYHTIFISLAKNKNIGSLSVNSITRLYPSTAIQCILQLSWTTFPDRCFFSLICEIVSSSILYATCDCIMQSFDITRLSSTDLRCRDTLYVYVGVKILMLFLLDTEALDGELSAQRGVNHPPSYSNKDSYLYSYILM